MGQRPKCKTKTMKHLEEEIDVNICYFGLGNDILDMAPKAQATKEKMIKSN